MLSGGGRRGRVVISAHGTSHSLALQQDAHSVLQGADLTSLDLLVGFELAAKVPQLA